MDWNAVFGLTVSPLELVVRGTSMYLFLFVLFRVVIKRRVGAVGMADILVLVIISDAAQNGLSGEYTTVTEAFILVGTIVGWDVFFDWLAFQVPAFHAVLQPRPLLLIDQGRVLWRNLRKEFVTEMELRSKLREHGIEDPREVVRAYMEPDGAVTVIKRNSGSGS
jgi:uncharacterized membrane protein YcaP (DUF421 family)